MRSRKGERGGDGCEQRPDEDKAREGLAPAAQELPDAEEDQGHRDRGQDPSESRGLAKDAVSLENEELRGHIGHVVVQELAGGREAGRKLIDALQLFYHVANIGDARSLAIHPATTTHSQLSLEDQLATGVSDGYVRLSVGIEHIDDIIADLEHGLAAAGRLASAA